MRFMVAVDCEGVACVVGHAGKALGDGKQYEWACRQATREADAAAKGLFDAGATQVVIWDNHSSGVNLDYERIDERCEFVLGSDAGRWPGLSGEFAGVAMVGYHPMDNTVDGVLAHSYSSAAFQYMKVNGVEVGEIEIDAACAGELGVPLIFVSSDDKGVAEAKRFMPWISTVATKVGMGWNAAHSKHPLRAAEGIRAATAEAARNIGRMKPFTFASPMQIDLRLKRLEDAQRRARGGNGWIQIEPYVCRRVVSSISESWL